MIKNKERKKEEFDGNQLIYSFGLFRLKNLLYVKVSIFF